MYEIPYQICAKPGCDANTEGNRPYCDTCKDDESRWHEEETMELEYQEKMERAEQESGYRSGKGE